MPAAAKRIEKSAKAYRSIGEAAEELGLQTHVLRYWETKFPRHLKPVKRPDGRRMFRPDDILALKAIQLLVHKQGLTLKGADRLLAEQGRDAVLDGRLFVQNEDQGDGSAISPARELQKSIATAFSATPAQTSIETGAQTRLESVLADLQDIKARLDAYRLDQAA